MRRFAAVPLPPRLLGRLGGSFDVRLRAGAP